MKHIMVDIETLGNGNDAAILSVGAVVFTRDGLGAEFYTNIDAQSCVDAGLKMDVGTVMWWMQQSDSARSVFKNKSLSLYEALTSLSAWIKSTGSDSVWGNGATFDNVILVSAYKAVGLPRPWSYRGDRCYRTLKALYPEVPLPEQVGTSHNALDDAKFQALHAAAILRHIGKV